ncbi:MAG TPA: lipoyl(octanoyl) transferase LipB [Frankiaceae bacterium]|nr:lipoyl(octanoyl) transferase LipB [Frankiaceae bacterium]
MEYVRCGVVPYDEAWAMQRDLHARRVAGEVADTCLLLEHPAVYTAGKRTEPWERPFDGTPVVDVDRGGKITWHGPGQLVGYPIVELADPVDVVAHVRRIEQALIDVCAEYGVAAGRVEGRSGVWVENAKVAAIGIRVAQRVTMHGFAVNCDADLTAYDRIVPCGIRDAGVTSLSVLTGRRVPVADVLPRVEAALTNVLEPVRG